MTKAKQKETALDLISGYIRRIPGTLDRASLDYHDDIITGMLRLAYKTGIITKQELDEIDIQQMEAYCTRKKELEELKTA